MYKRVKKKRSGGKRKNAGRKKKADKKIQVTIYVEPLIISKHGGLSSAKIAAYDHLRLSKP